MRFISNLYYFFTPYTDARERAVGSFFKDLTERSSRPRTQAKLNNLLQRNIAVINLWTEYRYKGYRYLSKSQRKKLYSNLQLITEDFDRYYRSYISSTTSDEPEKMTLIRALMGYFSIKRGLYEYRESSSFGRLLRDPAHEKLVGDCNQIVTLYMYLYSQYHDIRDLQVRELPGHVALHYNGIDIETTSGRLADYSKQKDSKLLPAEEIVSINLLDTTDSYLSTHEVDAEDFLQASRFAFILSHNRDIVTRNLDVAYSRLINSLMKRNNYNQALKFAAHSRDITLLNVVGHNGSLYELQRKNYTAARRFAQYALKRDELIRTSWQSEATHYYQTRHYHDAMRAFKHTDDQTMICQCYEALFFEEQQKLGANLTTDSLKKHSRTIKRMRSYAKKSGNKKLIQHADRLHKYS
jgi:hypothetical protein